MKTPRPRIYVAGPISADTNETMEQHVRDAIDTAAELVRKGYSPFIPHLDYYFRQRHPDLLDYETLMELDASWVHVSDAMFVVAISPGVRREIDLAETLSIPIYYILTDVPVVREAD